DSTLLPEQALKTLLSISHTGRLSGSLTLYHQHFFRFIYLRPDGLRTTIRGTFPAFRYDQTAALIAGADLDLNFAISPALSWAGKAAWLYAQNLADGLPLIFMPANWFENSLSYEWKTIRQSRFYLSIGIRHTFEQARVPEGVDFIPPPPAYTLLNAHAGASKKTGMGTASLTLGCDNLLNTAYRDYLDRFRYFADAPGRNFSVKLTFTF
ncbi:MAG: TonB-dependent receptor, partial [Bacteroidetes bacterium]